MKSFTDIEQSKKLAEILPLESADMRYAPFGDIHPWVWDGEVKLLEKGSIPCWSLAALLERLDDEITDEDGNDYNLTIIKEGLQYQLYYHDEWYQAEDIETEWYDNMIDACVEMIIKLKEKGLL